LKAAIEICDAILG